MINILETMPRDSNFKRSRVGVAFEPIPSGEENPPNSFQVGNGARSVGRVSTSVFKDIMGMMGPCIGPLLCVGLVIGVVVLFVLFIVPIITGLFSFGSSVVSGVEGDVKSVILTAKNIIDAGITDFETGVSYVVTKVDSWLCSWFHIECTAAVATKNFVCCSQWDGPTLAILIQKGAHVATLCSTNHAACSTVSHCSFGFTSVENSGIPRSFPYWPGTEDVNKIPTGDKIAYYMGKNTTGLYHIFNPPVQSCGFQYIYWVGNSRVNPRS